MYFKEAQVKELLEKFKNKFKKCECLIELLAPMLLNRSKMHDAVDESVSFSWTVPSGKVLEEYNSYVKFIEDFNLYDFNTKRWKYFRFLMFIPGFKRNTNNKVTHIKIE